MRLRRVKAAIGSVLAAVTLLSMSLTGVTAAQASDDNLALNQTVTASSYEVATTAPEKAVDGDLGTRWGTAQNKAANEWIEVGFGGTKTVKQINIDFERKDADQNITSFKVELKQGDTYTKVYQKDTRAKQQEIILLDQAQQASAVKVTVLSADGGTMNWVNVGINEISVYSAPKETVLDTARHEPHARRHHDRLQQRDGDAHPRQGDRPEPHPPATTVGPAATRPRATSG